MEAKNKNPIIEQANKEKELDSALNYNLDKFLAKLNKAPKNVAKNTQQGGYEYLPISHVLNISLARGYTDMVEIYRVR